ncbi:MAG: hypothetical protein ACRC1P_07420 [Cellulosilyticaceae bacterium]
MFGFKSKRQKTYIRIYFAKDNKLQEYLIGEIPIREKIVIEKSIQFFDDPEPCYIHRGAVIMRLNEEILNAIEQYQGGSQVAANAINKEILGYIDLQEVEILEVFKK